MLSIITTIFYISFCVFKSAENYPKFMEIRGELLILYVAKVQNRGDYIGFLLIGFTLVLGTKSRDMNFMTVTLLREILRKSGVGSK